MVGLNGNNSNITGGNSSNMGMGMVGSSMTGVNMGGYVSGGGNMSGGVNSVGGMSIPMAAQQTGAFALPIPPHGGNTNGGNMNGGNMNGMVQWASPSNNMYSSNGGLGGNN